MLVVLYERIITYSPPSAIKSYVLAKPFQPGRMETAEREEEEKKKKLIADGKRAAIMMMHYARADGNRRNYPYSAQYCTR